MVRFTPSGHCSQNGNESLTFFGQLVAGFTVGIYNALLLQTIQSCGEGARVECWHGVRKVLEPFWS